MLTTVSVTDDSHEALVMQEQAAWRCRKAWISSAFVAHDLANAYTSGAHGVNVEHIVDRTMWSQIEDGTWQNKNTHALRSIEHPPRKLRYPH